MKTVYLFFLTMIMLEHQVWSNNVQVSNVRLTGQNTTDDFTMVEFDITWEKSWRYDGGPTTGSSYYSNLSFGGDQSGLIPSFPEPIPLLLRLPKTYL